MLDNSQIILLQIAAQDPTGWTRVEGPMSLAARDLARRGYVETRFDFAPTSIEFRTLAPGAALLETRRERPAPEITPEAARALAERLIPYRDQPYSHRSTDLIFRAEEHDHLTYEEFGEICAQVEPVVSDVLWASRVADGTATAP